VWDENLCCGSFVKTGGQWTVTAGLPQRKGRAGLALICKTCGNPIPDNLLACEVCLSKPPAFPAVGPLYALSLWNPWAVLLATGAKQYETRGYDTHIRGWVAIQATKRFTREHQALSKTFPFWDDIAKAGHSDVKGIPRGAIIGVAVLQQVYETRHIRSMISNRELQFGNFNLGRFAWRFGHPVPVDPIPCTGHQRFWHAPFMAIEALCIAVGKAGYEVVDETAKAWGEAGH
jgi:hypothetical protein